MGRIGDSTLPYDLAATPVEDGKLRNLDGGRGLMCFCSMLRRYVREEREEGSRISLDPYVLCPLLLSAVDHQIC